ncbi:acyl-CoA thioesterase [Pseudozobellia thermophila]|uniref:Acyl-CoA thioester hydrolase n=1 Tax=Pseudozobellia thermophila TaxID=192903 RepID=A0A1M6F6S6_9FLAO|nr:thioesterase family protein [Pseudozobellia thermophila]SHI93397.1 acyl-CoA thioester hydrolase [Pseudozobellia thermophila]
MQKYQKTLVVEKDDLDELDHVNNVRYVQWIQDISKEHWLKVCPEEIRNTSIWVVMTHHITYKFAAKLGDVINIETYISKSKGARSERIVEMHDARTGQLLLHSKTEWCLLNSKSLKPVRIPEEVKKMFHP